MFIWAHLIHFAEHLSRNIEVNAEKHFKIAPVYENRH